MNRSFQLLQDVKKKIYDIPKDIGIEDWAYETLTLRDSPLGDKIILSSTPWLRGVLDALLDPKIEIVSVSAAAQTGKSLAISIFACWTLARDKRSVIVVLDTEKQMRLFNDLKLFPLITSCKELHLPATRDNFRKSLIHFPTCSIITGSANESFLRSHTIPVVIGDECSRWEPRMMDNAAARASSFANRKLVFTSTPLDENNEFANMWDSGTQEHWALQCQGCKEIFIPKFRECLKWDNSLKGFDAIKETIFLVCPHCEHKHTQDPKTVKRMNAGGCYIQKNPHADPSRRSFTFSKLALPKRVASWEGLVSKFLSAKESSDLGLIDPLQSFVNLQLGEIFRSGSEYDEKRFDFVDEYKPLGKGYFRIMSIDVQKDLTLFYYIVREWDKKGNSRLIKADKAYSWENLMEIQKEYKVDSQNVIVDAAYAQDLVITLACNNGWLPVRGSAVTPAENYIHNIVDPAGNVIGKTRRLYSPRVYSTTIKLKNNKWASYVKLAVHSLSDLFVSLRDQRVPHVKWEISTNACGDNGDLATEYIKQIQAKERVSQTDIKNKNKKWINVYVHDHFFDCEVYQIGMALIRRVEFSAYTEQKVDTKKKGRKKKDKNINKDNEGRS